MDQKKGLRLALGYQSRVGKDTFASYVNYEHGCNILSFARGVYQVTNSIQTILGKPVEKDATLLQIIGTKLREHYGENVWIDRVARSIDEITTADPNANIIVTDMRFKNEMNWLKDHGFITIKITRNDRIIDRDPRHISEIDLEGAEFDYYIENNGTRDEYYSTIDEILSQI